MNEQISTTICKTEVSSNVEGTVKLFQCNTGIACYDGWLTYWEVCTFIAGSDTPNGFRRYINMSDAQAHFDSLV